MSSSSLPQPQPVLILYSHGRNPPLNPPPDLKYDLRSIPNPPKALRAVSDGRSKRLREHLLTDEKFVQKLTAVEEEVRSVMETRLAEWAKRQDAKSEENEFNGSETVVQPDNEDDGLERKDHSQDIEEEEEEEDEDEENSDSESRSEDAIILRVGCNCALGHHRSVAFVYELANKPWPKDWIVEVVHRDLEKKRSGGSREAQKASWRGEKKKDRRIMGEGWEAD